MREPRLKRYTCAGCQRVDLRRGGSIDYTCLPCLRVTPSKHWKLQRIISGQGESARAVAEAIRYGNMPKPSVSSCCDCGGPATSYDHRDYNKPLDVDAVCRSCNTKRGYAIPLHGYIAEFLSVGGVPYRNKGWLVDLFARMGIHAPELSGMPRWLSADHWQVLARHFVVGAPHV